MEIKIVVFSPAMDTTKFVADVYVDGIRVMCGQLKNRGTKADALRSAIDWLSDNLISCLTISVDG